MGVQYEDVPIKKNSEVVHPGHPALIDTGLLADKGKTLKAGTILKMNALGNALEPAGKDDTPAAVLVENSDGKNAEVTVLWHGAVVLGRLVVANGANAEAPEAAITNKLRTAGIYPVQLFTSAKKG
jgi:hypothetical protein